MTPSDTDELHRAFVDGGIVLDEPAAQPTQAEIEALVDSLKEGVRSCGMHDDGDTELFRIEDANDLMFEAATALTALQADLAAAVARAERAEGALRRIDQWSRAYPLGIFPEPDMGMVRVILEAAGMSLDAVSASNMRHVINGVGDIARAALPDAKGE